MISILDFGNVTSESYAEFVCDHEGCIHSSPVYGWLMYGKLPIDETVNPGYDDKTITAGMKNRYLRTVFVKRIPQITMTISLAVAAVATFTIDGAYSAVSTNPSFATATCVNDVVTITGVAAGTTVVTVTDINDDVIATITVTVA